MEIMLSEQNLKIQEKAVKNQQLQIQVEREQAKAQWAQVGATLFHGLSLMNQHVDHSGTVNVQHSGTINQNVYHSGNINHNVNGSVNHYGNFNHYVHW